MIEENRGSMLNPDALLALYQISQDELDLVRDFGGVVIEGISDQVGRFYDWLKTQPEYEEYFSDDQVQKRVEGLQTNYWQQFFRAEFEVLHRFGIRVHPAEFFERVFVGFCLRKLRLT